MQPVVTSIRFQRLAKESLWVVAGQVAAAIGSLMVVRTLTTYLQPDQYGQLALGLTFAGLINQVVMGGVIAGGSRFYSIAAEKNELPAFWHAMRKLLGFATIATLVIALAMLLGLVLLDLTQWLGLSTAIFLLSVLSGYNGTLSGIQNAARQRVLVATHLGLDTWLRIALAVGMMLWVGRSSTAVILGYALSSIVMVVSQFLFLRRLLPHGTESPSATKTWVLPMWRYAWPFSVWGVFTWAQQVSDRWALQSFAGAEEVGKYAVLYQISYAPIGMFMAMVMAFIGPILYQQVGIGEDPNRNIEATRLTWRLTWTCLAVTIVASVMMFFLHSWVFQLLVARSYSSVSYLLPWVVLAGGIFSAGQILALKLMADMKPSAMTSVKITSAILGVIMNIYGAAQFGVDGVVAALVGFSVIYFVWMALAARNLSSNRDQRLFINVNG